MDPLIIGTGITIIILALLFGKPVVDTARTMRANKKLRIEMFECIGSEWIMRMNATLAGLAVDRNPSLPIQERFHKEGGGWIFLVPARNIATNAPFALVIGATALIGEPKPHVKTILIDLIVTDRNKPEWWIEGYCATVFPDVKKNLVRQGLIFDVADKDPA